MSRLESLKSSELIVKQPNIKNPVNKYHINSKKVNEQTSDNRTTATTTNHNQKSTTKGEGLPVVNDLLVEFNRILNDNNQNLKLNQKKLIAQLNHILTGKHLKAMMDAHDQLVNRDQYNQRQYLDEIDSENVEMEDFALLPDQQHYNTKPGQTATAQRIINIRKGEDEPLGITVKDENGQVMIARIMAGKQTKILI